MKSNRKIFPNRPPCSRVRLMYLIRNIFGEPGEMVKIDISHPKNFVIGFKGVDL